MLYDNFRCGNSVLRKRHSSSYALFMQCLESVFPSGSSRAKFLVTFGDNDVGGEGRDRMTEQVLG